MTTAQMSAQDQAVTAKYLHEALGKERQLETALQAQIGIASHPSAKHALSQHLAVTHRQVEALEGRLDELGAGTGGGLSVSGVAGAATGLVATLANKGLALAKGPLHALRGTSPADNELRNLRDCYWNEAEEIAHYHVIETVAHQLGDHKTAELAARHRAEEEQMQRTLEGLLPGLVREVVVQEAGHHHAEPTPNPTVRAATKPRRVTSASTATVAKPTPPSTARATATPRAKPAAAARAKATTPKPAAKAATPKPAAAAAPKPAAAAAAAAVTPKLAAPRTAPKTNASGTTTKPSS